MIRVSTIIIMQFSCYNDLINSGNYSNKRNSINHPTSHTLIFFFLKQVCDVRMIIKKNLVNLARIKLKKYKSK